MPSGPIKEKSTISVGIGLLVIIYRIETEKESTF
jgi:hypothetical protein